MSEITSGDFPISFDNLAISSLIPALLLQTKPKLIHIHEVELMTTLIKKPKLSNLLSLKSYAFAGLLIFQFLFALILIGAVTSFSCAQEEVQMRPSFDFSRLKRSMEVRSCSQSLLDKSAVQDTREQNQALSIAASSEEVGGYKAPLVIVGLGNSGSEYVYTRHNAGRLLVESLAASLGAQNFEKYTARIHKEFTDLNTAQEYFEFTEASSPTLEQPENGQGPFVVNYDVGGELQLLPADHPWVLQFGEVLFVYPHFDINESGEFLGSLAAELNIPRSHFLVVYDDKDLKPMKMGIARGKPAPLPEPKAFADNYGDGHNGLRSINLNLGGADYHRLRIGVSSPRQEGFTDLTLADWVLGEWPEVERNVWLNDAIPQFHELIYLFHQGRDLDEKKRQKIVGQISRTTQNISAILAPKK